MPFVTFTIQRGLSASDKAGLSQAMIEAQVAAGYPPEDLFHRFYEVGAEDLYIDPRFPDYSNNRSARFMIVDVIISRGKPADTADIIARESTRLFAERFQLAPQDILYIFQEVEPYFPRFPPQSNASGITQHA
jgi:phenylpyruvate tautomerase PptA (4-oxalocrotonate tautomerase family)